MWDVKKSEKPKMTARLTEGITLSSTEFEKAISEVGGGNNSITIKSLVLHQLSLRYLLDPQREMPSR